ncbi:hypothetical protein MMC14_003379 [Varicellaria rhodocarpa]|nr:hypothetical protein [Varicellaria rhodocarpa]
MAARLKNAEVLALLTPHCTKTQINEALISATTHEAKDDYGWTPLHYASEKHATDNVKLLLEHDRNVEVKDDKGRTPLLYASGGHVANSVKLLLEHGASIKVRDDEGRTPLHWLVCFPKSPFRNCNCAGFFALLGGKVPTPFQMALAIDEDLPLSSITHWSDLLFVLLLHGAGFTQ